MTTKKSVKKPAKKAVKKPVKETVAVKPSVNESGVVTMRPVEDAGEATEGKAIKMKPTVDKETGVLTMVPVEDEE